MYMKVYLVALVTCFFISQLETVDLDPNGANVCRKDVAFTKTGVRRFYGTRSQNYETCCKKIVFCFKKCEKYRMVTYAFTKVVPVAKLRAVYHCCPGWARLTESDKECSKAICRPKCDIGNCVRPNICQYDSSKTNVKSILNKAKCGGILQNIAKGDISLHGKDRNPLLNTELCRWQVNVPDEREEESTFRITFQEFKMDNTTNCAESMITLRTRDKQVFFFCSAISPSPEQYFVIRSSDFVVEAIRSNWKDDDGFKMTFEKIQADTRQSE